MPLDPVVVEAVKAELKSLDQPEPVQRRLLQWLNDLADGLTDLSKSHDAGKHLDGVLSEVRLPTTPDSEE